MTTLLLALTLSLPVDSQTYVYCENRETKEIRVFNATCPDGWSFMGFVR